ncbi:MAG: helix-turn-helix transcriptional regulator [Verrucomicrobia bacterium]|nr:helix-turn-helix transcriptional regulator [Verrucomicrobiota bacterium]MBS0636252.1 helix-turn-helix transcriptional regulator [Verrucomicrobiota bacterium]
MKQQNIAKIIRFHRKQAGLSQEELAAVAGVGKTTVFDIEKGKLTIRFSTLLKLLHALNIQITLNSKLMEHFDEKS